MTVLEVLFHTFYSKPHFAHPEVTIITLFLC